MTNSPAHSLYPGVNAHLNSFLQQTAGGWQVFHNVHLAQLLAVIDAALPRGYVTISENGLQIDTLHFDMPPARSRLRPDLTVYRQRAASSARGSAVAAVSAPLDTLPIQQAIDEEEAILALRIYQTGEQMTAYGKPVTQIELLSPSNKKGGTGYEHYFTNRIQALSVGLNLVEIDYLNEYPPLLKRVAVYPDEPDAVPYAVFVTDPRPSIEDGVTQFYGFGLLEPLPIVIVPLAGDDQVVINFNDAYQRTLAISKFFQGFADFRQPPARFDRYREDDQMRLREHLAREGIPLPDAPPAPDSPA